MVLDNQEQRQREEQTKNQIEKTTGPYTTRCTDEYVWVWVASSLLTNGRNINGKYERGKKDLNGFPTYHHVADETGPISSDNVIWYCHYSSCNFQGWVLGTSGTQDGTLATPGSGVGNGDTALGGSGANLFSQYPDTNGRRLYMRYKEPFDFQLIFIMFYITLILMPNFNFFNWLELI